MADTRGTILIVDDEPATIELLSDYLGGKRLAIARAHNLDEALAELDRERPDGHMARARRCVGLS
jgi:CheY-like chemotaxis protein